MQYRDSKLSNISSFIQNHYVGGGSFVPTEILTSIVKSPRVATSYFMHWKIKNVGGNITVNRVNLFWYNFELSISNQSYSKAFILCSCANVFLHLCTLKQYLKLATIKAICSSKFRYYDSKLSITCLILSFIQNHNVRYVVACPLFKLMYCDKRKYMLIGDIRNLRIIV